MDKPPPAAHDGDMTAALDPDRIADRLAEIAAEAGLLLSSVPDRRSGCSRKQDGSVATAADVASETLILARLAADFAGIPVLAEESLGRSADLFFLVDPLDGTSDYVSGAGEYSVNIALVAAGRPIAAALASPHCGRVWSAGSSGAREARVDAEGRLGPTTGIHTRAASAQGIVALGSRRHGDEESDRVVASFPKVARMTASSATKFGLIAAGEADLYIRCGATMEWDTAAGDHIVAQAGGLVVGPDLKPLRYGRAETGFRNGPFAAMGDASLLGQIELPSVCSRSALFSEPARS